jgi:rfaE bifunctional protein nucleotidyltransferase chain/domain
MSKFVKASELELKLNKSKKTVLVTGCFDILHSEHIKFLKTAKSKGDILLVGIESDKRVALIKGKGRPVNKIKKRVSNLLKSKIPDYIFVLPDDFSSSSNHERLISRLKPDMLAVSSHTSHQDKKKEIMERYGGELRVILTHNPSVSTSKIIKRLNL